LQKNDNLPGGNASNWRQTMKTRTLMKTTVGPGWARLLISTGALARWKRAVVSGKLFQQFARRLKKPLKRLPAVAAPLHRAEAPVLMRGPSRRAVAQISNLPYRRFLICAARLAPARGEAADALPNTIRRYSRLQICATWSAPAAGLLFAVVLLLAPPARAATNDLTSAIQRGLFEEEANQNLGAAITAYQAVAS